MSNNEAEIAVLDLKTIADILVNFGQKLTPKDLKNPSLELLSSIYKGFLQECMTIKFEQIETEPAELILHFNEEEIKSQSESFKFIQFYVLIKHFADHCGLKLNLTDIFFPQKKIAKHLSAMISFAKFEFMELPDFSSIQQKSKKYVSECDELRKEIDFHSANIYLIKSENNQKKPLIDQCKKRVSMLKEKLAALREERKKLAAEKEEDTKKENAFIAEEKELNLQKQAIQKKMILYERLIIKSPERLNRDLEKNEARICELEKLIREKLEENDEEKRKLFEREKFVENYRTIKEILDNHYENHVQNANLKLKEIESLKEEITNLNFLFDQRRSNNKSLTSDCENSKKKFDMLVKDGENQLIQFKENNFRLSEKLKLKNLELNELDEKKKFLNEEKSKFLMKTQELTNQAFEKIIKYQNAEEIFKANTQNTINLLNAQAKDCDEYYQSLMKKFKIRFIQPIDAKLEELTSCKEDKMQF